MGTPAGATTPTIATFDVSGAVYTFPLGINDLGQAVGYYSDSSGFHGFVRDAQGNITTFDPSGSVLTVADGINNLGQVVGYYSLNNLTHGFVRDAQGNITTFDPSGSVSTIVQRINNLGQAVGYYSDGSRYHGFVRDAQGNITTFDPSGSMFTVADGINNPGQVVGYYYLNNFQTAHGFVRDAQGNITTLDVSDAVYTFPFGINNLGQAVGFYYDSNRHAHGFITTFVVPFAAFSAKVDINLESRSFDVNSTFTLGSGGSINPLTDAVTFQLGGSSITIPAGSFQLVGNGKRFVFDGTTQGVELSANLTPLSGNSYSLKLESVGAFNLPTANPVTVVLTIGNNTGSSQINTEIQ